MRIRIHPSLYIYLIGIAALSSLQTCLAMILALLVHEAGHLAVCRLAGEQIDLLELTPSGGIMTRKRGTTAHKGIKGFCVHVAGPLSNYALLLISGSSAIQQALEPPFLRSVITTNASMLMLNIMPVLPLDGGQMVFSIGYYFFPVAKLVFALSAMGVITGLGGLFLALYGITFRGILNCSLLIISVHLIISAKRAPHALLAENIWSVIQERMLNSARLRRIEHYQVSPDMPLFELIPILKQQACVCFSFSSEGKEYILGEEAFCRSLLQTPSGSIAQAYANWVEKQRKK